MILLQTGQEIDLFNLLLDLAPVGLVIVAALIVVYLVDLYLRRNK